jgi:hypothetical protein
MNSFDEMHLNPKPTRSCLSQRPTTDDAMSHQPLAISYQPNKKPCAGFPGHRARFSYDDLFCYLVMNPELRFPRQAIAG